MTACNDTLNVDGSLARWNDIVADYRQICILRRTGRDEEATRLVNEKLQPSIALWAREDTRNPAQKRATLENLFATEHKFLDSMLASQHELASRLADRLVPAVCQQMKVELHEMVSGQFETLRHLLAQAGGAFERRTEKSTRERGRERIRFDDIPSVINAVLAEQRADNVRGTFAH